MTGVAEMTVVAAAIAFTGGGATPLVVAAGIDGIFTTVEGVQGAVTGNLDRGKFAVNRGIAAGVTIAGAGMHVFVNNLKLSERQ